MDHREVDEEPVAPAARPAAAGAGAPSAQPGTPADAPAAPAVPDAFRIDVVSDTHGVLPELAYRAVAGADLIVHAGDICDEDVLERLRDQAPVLAVLGNNDWPGQYGPDVRRIAQFERMGVTFKVAHIRSDLGLLDARVAICGHTHVARVERVGACTLVNPGSTTRPSGGQRPSMSRIVLGQGVVRSVRLLALDGSDLLA